MTAVLELKNLAVQYRTNAGTLTALRDINLTIQPGEIVGIVGESGCGKSTVAAAMMKILPPNGFISSGEVLFKGRDLLKLPADQMRTLRGTQLSMIFQDPMSSLNPVFNIETQMLDILRSHPQNHNGHSRSDGELRQKAISMLERVGIPDAAERIQHFPHQFSGGMRQRIFIAMALMANPALLIADEPTSALDVTLEAQIMELIRDLRDELGTAILYISHDLGVIAQLCDQVVVMYAGRIVESGDILTIFDRPTHPYTKALLGAYPSHRQHRERLLAIPGKVPSLKDLPPGCKFADRCGLARSVCFSSEPEMQFVTEGHAVLCHFYREAGTAAAVDLAPAVSIAQKPTRRFERRAGQPEKDVLVSIQGLRTYFGERVGLLDTLLGPFRQGKRGYVRAVDGVSLDIKYGETIGLVGESGSGKTTLGKTVLRLVKSTGGEIVFGGQTITHSPENLVRPLRARMQMIYQDPYSSLSPRMKVSELLVEPFRIQGVASQPKNEVARLLDMVGLSTEQADKYPHELSGGQARRVGIARALALNPDFLVADEPTSGLDVSVAASILNLLKDLRDQLGLTYLIITHNLNVINFISNKVGVMYLGKLVEYGFTDSIYRETAHPYTEALMASISEPDPHKRMSQQQRVLVKGEIPSPKNPPPGCPFHPRCRYAEARCSQETPGLTLFAAEHLTACFYPERVQRAGG